MSAINSSGFYKLAGCFFQGEKRMAPMRCPHEKAEILVVMQLMLMGLGSPI
jgi:hypothetical protein